MNSRTADVMRAAVVDGYWPPEVVHLAEMERPRTSTGEVLVRVQAATVALARFAIRAAARCSVPGVPLCHDRVDGELNSEGVQHCFRRASSCRRGM